MPALDELRRQAIRAQLAQMAPDVASAMADPQQMPQVPLTYSAGQVGPTPQYQMHFGQPQLLSEMGPIEELPAASKGPLDFSDLNMRNLRQRMKKRKGPR